MSLNQKRNQIEALLYRRNPADAQAVFYAYHHPDEKTQLFTLTNGTAPAEGYICLSRTGMDLFRQLVTLRLPLSTTAEGIDPLSSSTLLHSALTAGTSVILSAPIAYRPILTALFDVQSEQNLRIMILDRQRFEPLIKVLVTQTETYNNLPRFLARSTSQSGPTSTPEVAASAGLNWQSDEFAEIYVHTKPAYRRRGFGRSVVAAVVQVTLDTGRTPLYAVGSTNEASLQLAESVGFVDTGNSRILLDATLRPRPS
jgi:GNAT superfamily N-acetyltransferase